VKQQKGDRKMGMRINTNMLAVNAQRNLRANQSVLQSNVEKLASGQRINKSSDDAAGMAISESIQANIKSFQQAGRNAQDGISFIQVAEGGMNEISNMITRLRELSVQAASDTVGERERGYLNNEVQQLKLEMERIAQSTEYNGTKLLSGQGTLLDFQIGNKNSEFLDRISYDPSKTDVKLATLGLDGIDVSNKNAAQSGLENLDESIFKLNANRAVLGALQNRLFSTIQNNEVAIENFSAAKSRIRDADYSQVTADLARDQVKSNASLSVLAQANSSTSSALKLL
jgi:flagellin